jgi:hypothetical protein
MDRGGEGTAGGCVTQALITHLRLTIKKLRREMFGPRSERQPFPAEGPIGATAPSATKAAEVALRVSGVLRSPSG